MRQILKTEVVARGNTQPYGVFTIASDSNPLKTYRVDVTNGRCDCPGWKFQRPVGGKRSPCKHLRGFGFTELTKSVEYQPVKADKSKVL